MGDLHYKQQVIDLLTANGVLMQQLLTIIGAPAALITKTVTQTLTPGSNNIQHDMNCRIIVVTVFDESGTEIYVDCMYILDELLHPDLNNITLNIGGSENIENATINLIGVPWVNLDA